MAACVCALCGRSAFTPAVDHVEASPGASVAVCEGCLERLEELPDDGELIPMPWNLNFNHADVLTPDAEALLASVAREWS